MTVMESHKSLSAPGPWRGHTLHPPQRRAAEPNGRSKRAGQVSRECGGFEARINLATRDHTRRQLQRHSKINNLLVPPRAFRSSSDELLKVTSIGNRMLDSRHVPESATRRTAASRRQKAFKGRVRNTIRSARDGRSGIRIIGNPERHRIRPVPLCSPGQPPRSSCQSGSSRRGKDHAMLHSTAASRGSIFQIRIPKCRRQLWPPFRFCS